jgi:hypothetical protein
MMAVRQFGQAHERQYFSDLEGSYPEQALAGKPEQQKFLGLLRFAGHKTGSFQLQKPLKQELFQEVGSTGCLPGIVQPANRGYVAIVAALS